MNEAQVYSLCEAVADIAFVAGENGYYSGDSRRDTADFISWAKEFEQIYNGHQWGVDESPDYIDAIAEFSLQKIKNL